MDIFIGGGADDLGWLGFGVVRQYAADFAARTGRPALYLPNNRPRRLRRALVAAVQRTGAANLVGHSWGAVDAYEAAVWAARRGLAVANLITLDPVSGPFRRPSPWPGEAAWLNVTLQPSAPDASDRLTRRRPLAHKPSRLPLHAADAHLVLDLHHWDVEAMMRRSGAEARLTGA
ncbi:hypothetical protein ACO2Q3_14440 [Caulobacter sp. KR2-114]|uniref:hypothetical protein n=1 Tax=Caulobacter sp. KR2-114 TaxID=3400912 RepID=UPI003C033E97